MPFKIAQNLLSYSVLNRSRAFRKTEKETCSSLWGQAGCSPCSLVLARGRSTRPKCCENDCSCGSSGLLGIRKCHKSQERDCLCKIPSPHFRLQRFRCIFFLYSKTIRLLGHTSQPGSTSASPWFIHSSSY